MNDASQDPGFNAQIATARLTEGLLWRIERTRRMLETEQEPENRKILRAEFERLNKELEESGS